MRRMLLPLSRPSEKNQLTITKTVTMHLEINDTTTLGEIQDIFSDFYPFLKLEFYHKSHKKYEASSELSCIHSDSRVGDLKKTHTSGILEILPMNIVADVEKEFFERFGLSVQVLRKTGEDWEQTTGMDDFTLKELNEFGRSSSDEFIIKDFEEGFEQPDEKPDKLY